MLLPTVYRLLSTQARSHSSANRYIACAFPQEEQAQVILLSEPVLRVQTVPHLFRAVMSLLDG